MRLIPYRADIDGLRALAVLGVLLYHGEFYLFGHRFLSGGYLGVDVFFVISGYLITALIVKEKQLGVFSFKDFYLRRIRRLLPALLTVLVFVLGAGWFILLPEDYARVAGGALSALLLNANHFYMMQDSYWAPASALSPLLHVWSLSVEEQFYLIFPIFLMGLLAFQVKWQITVLFGVFCLSLMMAHIYVMIRAEWAFYAFPFRLWELLVGALSFYIAQGSFLTLLKRRFHFLNEALCTIGLLLIILSFIFFKSAFLHPSFLTLIPILGAVFIIISGGASKSASYLSLKPIVFIGLISYSLYLWHMPFLTFGRHVTLGIYTHLDVIAWLFMAFFISILSWYFIERPFRYQCFKTSYLYGILAGGFLALLSVSVLILHKGGYPERLGLEDKELALFHYGDGLKPSPCLDQDNFLQSDSWCQIGVAQKDGIDFIVAGDSHAYAQMPFIDEAAQQLGLSGLVVTRSGCPMLIGLEPDRGAEMSAQCLAQEKALRQFILENDLKKVWLINRWNYYLCGERKRACGSTQQTRLDGGMWSKNEVDREKNLKVALDKTLDFYSKNNVNVHVVEQVPHHLYAPLAVYKRLKLSGGVFQDWSFEREKHENFIQSARSLLQMATKNFDNSSYVTQIDLLCPNALCFIGKEKLPYYHDDDHLSWGAKDLLAPWYLKQLR